MAVAVSGCLMVSVCFKGLKLLIEDWWDYEGV